MKRVISRMFVGMLALFTVVSGVAPIAPVASAQAITPTIAPTITVLSPNGGEHFKIGSRIDFSWTYTNTSNTEVDAYLYSPILGQMPGYEAVYRPSRSSGTSTGTFKLRKDLPAGEYKILICNENYNASSGKTLCDLSNNYFTISSTNTPSPINVVEPVLGEKAKYAAGSVIATRWTPATTPISTIEIVSFYGNYSAGIYGKKYGNRQPITTGKFAYTIPSTLPSDTYYFKLTPADGSAAVISQTFFVGEGPEEGDEGTIFLDVDATNTIVKKGEVAYEPDTAEFTIMFEVGNYSAQDKIIHRNVIQGSDSKGNVPGLLWRLQKESTIPSTTAIGMLTAVGVQRGDTREGFIIPAGQTRAFIFTVAIPATVNNMVAGVELVGIVFNGGFMARFDSDVKTKLVVGLMTNGATTPTTHPSFRILSPNGGESFVVGGPMKVSWTSEGLTYAGPAFVHAYLVNEKGTHCFVGTGTLFQSVFPTFTVPATCSGTGRALQAGDYGVALFVQNPKSNNEKDWIAHDTSDKYFTVKNATPTTAPSITVTEPRAGQTFKAGERVVVKYTTNNFPRPISVAVQLNKGAEYPHGAYNPIGTTTGGYWPATGSYTFTLPKDLVSGNDYSFLVSSDYPDTESSGDNAGHSSNFIVIGAPTTQTASVKLDATLEEVQSNGTTVFTLTSDQSFKSYKLELQCDKPGLEGEAQIKGGLGCNDTLVVGLSSAGNYQASKKITIPVKFNNLTNESRWAQLRATVYKEMDQRQSLGGASFDVKVLPSTGSLPLTRVISPNGGETLKVGDKITIAWKNNSLVKASNVKIDLLDEPTRLGKTIFSSTRNDGEQQWVVEPLTVQDLEDPVTGKNRAPSGKYVIWIGCEDHSCIVDDSDGYFKIVSSDSPSPIFTRDLTLGSRGSDVTALNTILIAKGFLYSSVSPLDYFGRDTYEALRNWQASVGLPATGYLGQNSRALLNGSTVQPQLPTLNISWPRGGEVYKNTDTIQIIFGGENIKGPVHAYLADINGTHLADAKKYTSGTGKDDLLLDLVRNKWSSTNPIPAGKYRIVLCDDGDNQTKGGYCAYGNYFSITEARVTPSASATVDLSTYKQTTPTPYISGTATGVSQVGVVLGNEGGKVYGSGLVSVRDGRWGVNVYPALSEGTYRIYVYDADNNFLTSPDIGLGVKKPVVTTPAPTTPIPVTPPPTTVTPPPTPVTYPTVPTNPSFVCAADGKSVTLKWSASSGAAGYVVHANPGVNNYATAAYKNTNVTSTSHILSSVTPGVTYTWWVQGKDSNGRLSQGSTGGMFSCAAPVTVTPPTTTPPSASTNTNLYAHGNFGTQTCTGITGWAFDPNSKSEPVTVKIYEGPTRDSNKLLATLTTDRLREDINTQYGLTGNHGFYFLIPSSLKTNTQRTLYAYVIDKQDGAIAQLNGVPKTIQCASGAAAGGSTVVNWLLDIFAR